MKFTTTLFVAVSVMAPLVSSHVVMNMPLPFNGDQDNAPLAADGSNYPCKLTGAPSGSAATTYTPGVAGSFTLKGSAVHGGGSCQISITYDNPPTKNSVFKVVQSYEGSCPINTAGNLPANPENLLPSIPVTLPMGLKAGEAVFAWTWFNRIGNREMYMNCAPITIGGSGSSDTVFESLPDMFVANIAVPQSQCTTKETFDILFPNPGSNLVKADGDTNFAPACGDSAGSGSGASVVAPAPSSTAAAAAPPNVTTQPALVGASSMSQPAVGTVFTSINGPVASAAPVMTTFMTVTQSMTQSMAAPTTEVPSPSAVMPTSTPAMAAPAPTGGSSSSSSNSSGEPVMMGTCDPSAGQILCDSSDLGIYYECYGSGTDGVKWGPFPVPENTACSAARGYFVNKMTNSRKTKRHAREHIKRTHKHRLA